MPCRRGTGCGARNPGQGLRCCRRGALRLGCRPGGGLGLFLVVNVLRKLGGQVRARNLKEGGAEVVLTLPFAALEVPP